jgi:hypothetical protein
VIPALERFSFSEARRCVRGLPRRGTKGKAFMFVTVLRKAFFAAALLLPAAALAAHGTTPLKVVEQIEIDAEPAAVWAVVSDFQNWTWLPGVVKIEGTGGNAPDEAKRRLTLNGGGVIEESLTKYDAGRMSLGYHVDSVDLKRLPATNYSAIVTVRPAEGGKSNVEWKGRFYRGYPNANPPPELSDEVAEKAVKDLHKANLAALKARVEGK